MDLPDPLAEYREFESRVDSTLARSGRRYAKNARIGGLEADFVVWSPDNESYLILELKLLVDDQPQLAARAVHLAARIQEQVGARRVFLVTPYFSPGTTQVGDEAVRVVNEAELLHALEVEFAEPTTHIHGFAAAAVIARGRVFAAMPFATEFDDVFFVAIAGAADQLDLAASRVDHDQYSGDVVAHIKQSIRGARVVVADLTTARPNVLYEVGFAHASDIPVVQICADDLNTLPFDVAHENTLAYQRGRTAVLRDALVDRLAAVTGIPLHPS